MTDATDATDAIDAINAIDATALSRYRRQITLAGFGLPGQQKLADAHIAVIGAGGLGSPALLYLAAAGVGTVTVIDDDTVELSNLHRQVVHTDAVVGEPKVDSARREMLARNPLMTIRTFTDRFTPTSAEELLGDADLVVDGADNFAARYTASHACAARGIPHVWGSILGFDAQMSVFWAGHGPVYEDAFPTPPPVGTVPSCSAAGVLGPVVGVVGTAMALEAVKLVTGTGDPLMGRLGYFDGLSGTWEYIPLNADPTVAERVRTMATPVAEELAVEPSSGADPVEPGESDSRLGSAGSAEPMRSAGLAEFSDLTGLSDPADLSSTVLLDVREPEEFTMVHIPGAINVPLSALTGGVLPEKIHEVAELSSTAGRPLVVYCAAGVRSAQAVDLLAAEGIRGVSYPGGIDAWLERQ